MVFAFTNAWAARVFHREPGNGESYHWTLGLQIDLTAGPVPEGEGFGVRATKFLSGRVSG